MDQEERDQGQADRHHEHGQGGSPRRSSWLWRLHIDTIHIPALRPIGECRAGDPDPGPEQHSRGRHRGLPCSEVVSYPGGEWLCTLLVGHSGAHVAGDGRTVVAVWTLLD